MRTVFWKDDKACMIDQTVLPFQTRILELDTPQEVFDAIYTMKVRGAPAIGVSGAMGVVLGVKHVAEKTTEAALAALDTICPYLMDARPTATNLAWGVERIWKYAKKKAALPYQEFYDALVKKVMQMADDEVAIAKRLSDRGAELIPDRGANISTHCSCGPLCTIDYGLNMGIVYSAHLQGKKVHVYTDETRPRLQGARLNTYDLRQQGIPYTLIPDNHAAYLMQLGKIDMVLLGADRVVANGDTAAKIGVYSLSIAAKEHGIPVYMCCPFSTVDFSKKTGAEIVVEERSPEEVLKIDDTWIAPPDTPVLNYAFDVTPARYFAGIITEVGIAYPPFTQSLKKLKEIYDREQEIRDDD